MHQFHTPQDADNTLDNDLELFPKRVRGPIPNRERLAWGLQAVHGPAITMILCFVAMLCGGTAAHVVLWLKFHPGDYQTAWTPPGVVITTLTFVGWLLHVYQNSKDRNES